MPLPMPQKLPSMQKYVHYIFIRFCSSVSYLNQAKTVKIIFGSGALPGKILLLMTIENNKTADYFRAG